MDRYLAAIYCMLVTLATADLRCSKKSNGKTTFRITQFTDTHFGENNTKDAESQLSFTNLISYETPDLVSLSGDIVSGYAWDGKTSNFFTNTFDAAIKPIEQSETYWAYTLGNHDDEADLNRTQIVNYAQTFNYSLTQQGPTTLGGVTNYVLTVFNDDNVPIANIWYLDSLDTNCYGVPGYNCVEFSNIEWYKETSINLESKYGRKLPGIMYIHIPLPELLMLYNNPSMTTNGLLQDSGVCCWSLNTGLFSVMIERGDITSVWHGHDHNNDFYGNYHGIVLGYGRKTGYGGYGPPSNMQRGTRVIEFDCENEDNYNISTFKWDTWIRENNGTKIEKQQSSNGSDWQIWKQCCASDGIVNRNLHYHDHDELWY